ncbi:activating signal cointegrator 1 complex subunit 1 [Halictus rubicundus]|uniref:activating signal cointegrator 1 complex subunit 1 n=1 Tax=Halictus rubicundus TaxID=77578 RepID=UPI004035F38C
MNVLKPELVWVDGRCYRHFGKKNSSDHTTTPYVEDDDLDIEDVEEFDDNDIEIVPYESSRYKHTFSVPKSYFPFIVGTKHTMRKKIEAETKTSLQIPKVGQDGDIVITGFYRNGIISARRRIDLLIIAARKKLHYTHFLSIPLNEDHITMKFNEFKNDILTNSGKTSRGVDENIFQTPSKLHMTIGMLKLLDDVEKEQAIKALDYCKENIVMPAIKKYGQIPICLQGISIMNDDLEKIKVLYAKVVDANNVLQEILDEIVNYYASVDLIDKERENVKLHVTLMNTNFKRTDEEKRMKVPVETFDGKDIFKAHENVTFGETVLKQIHISQLGTVSSNGYYQAIAKINLTEGF